MMRYLFASIATLAWGLWFGGVMGLFLWVVRLSQTFAPPRRALFSEAASASFFVFERYQLIVGAVALVATVAWRIAAPGVSRTILFCVLALAATASISQSHLITPKIDALRSHLDEPESVARFQKLHGLSMIVYTTQAGLLLVAGALLPLAMRAEKQRES